MQQTFHLDSWAAAYLEGVTWLNEHAPPRSRVCAVAPEHIAAVYARPGLDLGCTGGPRYYLAGTGLTDHCAVDPETCDTIAADTVRVFEIRRMDSTLLFIAERKSRLEQ